jgi:hypothetical protein
MKIVKYTEFIVETTDTIENYSNSLLGVLKNKIDKMFEYESEPEEGSEEEQMTIKKAKFASNKDKNKPTFKEFGVRLDSSEISNRNTCLTIKFSDDENSYSVFIKVDTAEVAQDIVAFPKEDNKDFSIEDIKKCHVTLKKYNIDTFEIVGQLDKNVDVKSLDEEYLINLKIELDDMFGDEEEEFEIETK